MQQQCIYINQKSTRRKSLVIEHTKICSCIFWNFSEYVRKYATEEALRGQENVSSDSESTMSDFSENEAEDMEL
jgi:hypothetical protein